MDHGTRWLILALALQTPLAAQWFAPIASEQIPLSSTDGRYPQVADLEQDGDLDVVFWRTSGPPLVYRNQGLGRFTGDSAGMPQPTGDATAMCLADIDGNGFPDLIAARAFARTIQWRNQGGVFTDVSNAAMPTVTMLGTPLAIVPFDCDGDLDVDLLLSLDSRAYLFVNGGTGTFTDGSNRLPSLNANMAESTVADVDGDGDLDILIARRSLVATDTHLLYLNNGVGFFTDVSAARLPQYGNTQYPGGPSLAAGDLDGDGDPDLVAAVGHDQLVVYRNGGEGNYTTASVLSFAAEASAPYGWPAESIRIGDLDGDGDRDVLFVAGSYGRFVLHNDGTGALTFASPEVFPRARSIVNGQQIADLDGDGDFDIVQATPRPNPQLLSSAGHAVLFQDGHGRFTDVGASPLPFGAETVFAVLPVDFDQDGLVDVVQAFGSGSPSSPTGMLFACRNRGDGTLGLVARLGYDQNLGAANALASADVDGDGWPDIYAGLSGGGNLLFRNLGNGEFAAPVAMPGAASWATNAVFGDFDRDGDQDLVTVRVTGTSNSMGPAQTMLFLNDGSGQFGDATAGRLPAQDDRSTKLLAFDLQRDGDLDLLIGNPNSTGSASDRLLVNDGSGHFVDQGLARLPNTTSFQTVGAAAADIDGNGAADLLLVNSSRLRVLLDNGAGFFVDATQTWADPFFYDFGQIATADIDGDGRIDLLATAPIPTLLRNLPAGRFAVQTNTTPPLGSQPQHYLQFPSLADFDGDGDLDLLHASTYSSTMHWNLAHQLSLPLLPKPATTFPLRIQADPGRGTVVRPAFFAASTGRLRTLMPFGTLWLDPAFPISIQAGLISAPDGVGEVQLTAGPWPGLQGTEFTVQGLVLSADGSWAQLTNSLTARLQ
jgi:hypothetical protein